MDTTLRCTIASALLLFCATVTAAAPEGVLKVCADPSNLPLSNDKGEGYENKIADALAQDLNRRVEYVFFPQRIGFVRNTLRKKDEQTQQWLCDVIMGVPTGYELTATTRPYMHSTYSIVVGSRKEFQSMQTADDLLKLSHDQLMHLKIGVFSRGPSNDWLLKNSLMEQAVVYTHQNGDVEESPARTIERDLAAGKIDAGILWGPIAALVVSNNPNKGWRALPFPPDAQIRFDYQISMGLRNGEPEWKKTLDDWIAGHGAQIDTILKSYRIPLVDASGLVSDRTR
jgi:quinoprotein dehydrogenase-associated probable ABC transporter substrate-binding protein